MGSVAWPTRMPAIIEAVAASPGRSVGGRFQARWAAASRLRPRAGQARLRRRPRARGRQAGERTGGDARRACRRPAQPPRRRRAGLGRRDVVEARPPALEGGRRRRPGVTMTGERLRHEPGRSPRVDLDPGQLLRCGELGELALEALPGDVASGRVEDADLIVEDERAETKRTERALEEDPRRARPGAVDAGEPRANGARVALSDEWTGGRCGGCDRHASLSETIDDAPGWPAERPRRVIGE